MSCSPEEQVSTAYGTVAGVPKKPRPRGTPAARLTWGRWSVGDRDQSRGRGREHAIERGRDDPRGGGANVQITSP